MVLLADRTTRSSSTLFLTDNLPPQQVNTVLFMDYFSVLQDGILHDVKACVCVSVQICTGYFPYIPFMIYYVVA